MNEYIQTYIRCGIRVFSCNENKTPATLTGFYAASTDQNTLQKQFTNESMLVGMPTGNMNNIVVIDFDVNKPLEDESGQKVYNDNSTPIIDIRTVEQLKEELKEYGELPDTLQVETPSGGRHLWFYTSHTNVSSKRRFFNKSLPIDIRANGGYVIVPDGKSKYIVYDNEHDILDFEDIKSILAPLPEWIENFKPQKSEYTPAENIHLPESEVREIRSALNYISSDDRDLWIKIGMALKSTGAPAARGLWDEWSQKSEKYNPLDQTKRWSGLKPHDINIGSLFHEAKQAGWVTTYDKTTPMVLPPVYEQPIKKTEKKNFPEYLLDPPGLVGDIARYINGTAIKPQPIFSLAAALCTVGTLAGRKLQTETRIRTNIYCLCVGPSGCGKEYPRKAIKDILQNSGCAHMASVEDIASDSAIVNTLEKEQAQIFLLDEIGRFLKTTMNAQRSAHLYNVVSVLLKLYSSADQVFSGKNYADKEKKVYIVQPNLCLYGTTVPDTLYKGLNVEHVKDGFLSRMLIFETDNPRPQKSKRKNLAATKVPIEIIDQVRAINLRKINFEPMGNLDHQIPNPYIVPMTDEAVDILEEFDSFIENFRETLAKESKVEAIYNRTVQMAEQIALIIAAGTNIENPKIDADEISYGINLAKHLADHMYSIVENFIAINEFEHELKRILNIIKECGKIKRSDLTRKTQNLQGYVRNDIIETLKESHQIHEIVSGTGNKQSVWFFPSDNFKSIESK